jgi:hypothetical protein
MSSSIGLAHRNLAAELQQVQSVEAAKAPGVPAATSCKGVLESSAKKLKPSPPMTQPDVVVQVNNSLAGPHVVNPQALLVRVDDELANEYLESKDKDRCLELSMIPGVFWVLPLILNGRTVWKQERSAIEGLAPLIIFYYPGPQHAGWYMSSAAFHEENGREKAKIYMWLGNDSLPMSRAHFPYWAKKHTDLVKVQSYVEFLQQQVTQLQESYQVAQGLLEQHAAEASAAQGAASAGADWHDDVAADPAGSGENDWGGDGAEAAGRLPKGRGGWMPRMARVMVAFYSRRWWNLENTLNNFYSNNQKLRELVDTGLQLQQ